MSNIYSLCDILFINIYTDTDTDTDRDTKMTKILQELQYDNFKIYYITFAF